jgi:predicted enzyme involved in methoxymalonyl-ACP biosynthesis
MREFIEQIDERIKKLQEETTDINIGKVAELNLVKIRLQQLTLTAVSHQRELLLQAYKDGFDSATESLLAANKMVQDRKLQ